jgi:hypothetical protein
MRLFLNTTLPNSTCIPTKNCDALELATDAATRKLMESNKAGKPDERNARILEILQQGKETFRCDKSFLFGNAKGMPEGSLTAPRGIG